MRFYSCTPDWLSRNVCLAAFHLSRLLFLGLITGALSMPALAGSVIYAYDALGRLTSATYATGAVITYIYDAAGNRTSLVTTGAP